MENRFAILANAYYSLNFDCVKRITNGLFVIDEKGLIEDVFFAEDHDFSKVERYYRQKGKLKQLDDSEIMLPGFIDLHNHAPQWAQAGTALDKPLEEWLKEYTFYLEAEFRDLDFAYRVYEDVVRTTLNFGTTTNMYFATEDTDAALLLARVCGESGQRGFVGRVVMDEKGSNPDFCCDQSAHYAIQETERFVKEVLSFQSEYNQKIYPVITPRFIPSCTDESLYGLGRLAQKYDVHIQTHCSESDWEHDYVRKRFGNNDAQILNRFGLITDKTIIAHAPFLEEQDVDLLVSNGTSIAHCPLSNAYFANSVLPFRDFHSKGVNIGLATDISGGYSPSMYSAIRQAVISSRMLQDGVNPAIEKKERGREKSALTLNNAFYAATVAGGLALHLPIGKLEKGYSFDVQIISLSNIPRFYPERSDEDLLHKILLLSESSNIKEVYVQGRKVK